MSDGRPAPSVAAVQALQLVELVARWGVSAEQLLAGLGLDVATLSAPGGRLPLALFERLAGRAKALTGEPGLGFYLGLSLRVSAYGYLGFAAMASATLRQALELAVRFAPTHTDAVALRMHEGGGRASLVVEALAPLGEATDVVVLSLLVGLHEIGAALTGQRIADRADVAFPEPAYAARFQHLTGGRMCFGQPAHQLVFDAAALDLPLVLADAGAHRLARSQCERELDALGYDGHATARVRALLPRAGPGFHALPEVAGLLSLSPRTLKRRLADEGTDFSTLLEEQRRERALLLLRSRDLSVAEVAEDLGYTDLANFTRAFRRWTGTTPTAFRRAARPPA
jgi:AraC-like DNA-binding protein